MANTASHDEPSQREWSAVQTAFALASGVETVIELPDGACSYRELLVRAGYRVIGSEVASGARTDTEALPFAAKSVDAIVSTRFPFHRDADTRRRMLREFGRVSRRWIILECRHRYSAQRVSVRRLNSDLEDAGLRMVKIIPVHRWISDKWVVVAESGYIDSESLAIRLRGSPYQELQVMAKLGEGKRSVVYRAHWRGREVGVKVYKPAAIARHARKHPLPLAEFEHRRNKAFFEARGMAKYVAEPLGFLVEPGFQMSLQECLDGELYYFAQREHATFISPRFLDDLAELVRLSHEAGLYDIDLHAMNVMVDRQAGGPKLFDFNQIPFNERPQNPLVSLALKLKLLGKGSRDLRKLARLRDFGRIERRLLKFYDGTD